jgi:hypothetical protein
MNRKVVKIRADAAFAQAVEDFAMGSARRRV